MQKRTTANPKRRLRALPKPPDVGDSEKLPDQEDPLGALAQRVTYGGNPEHKRDPGDFDLNPPSQPRQGKTLCDDAQVFNRSVAESLLKEGIRRGLISVQERNGWPQNVWAVADNGVAVEAMLENRTMGIYHGYPMLSDDPLRQEVLARWNLP